MNTTSLSAFRADALAAGFDEVPERAWPPGTVLDTHTPASLAPPVFAGGGLVARELGRSDVPALQALFDANPGYFVTVNGAPAPADAALETFDGRPPPHLACSSHPCLGLFGAQDGRLEGAVVVARDFCVAGLWHLALFFIDQRHHGLGVAPAAYQAFEDWARASDAHAVRLTVVVGNTRAERFWQRQGYVELRRREGVDTGGRLNTVRAMLKPLLPPGAAPQQVALAVAEHFERVPRDRPDSTLP